MNYLVVSYHAWRPDLAERLTRRTPAQFKLVSKKEELTSQFLKEYSPEFIFFVHWPYLISPDIFESYKCVIFHMTDLPFGRGGSPLQNLIARGIYETKISALECVRELDAGPVYLKRPLSLYGTAQEIYMRASETIEEMIITLVKERPIPAPQEGEVVEFKRRTPKDGNLGQLRDLRQIHDYIRMLDADGYPQAFVEVGEFVYKFSRSSLKNGYIEANVRIERRDKGQ